MRTFVFGDIHGQYNLFLNIIKHINPQKEDRFIFVGDLIDRGPDSCILLDFLINFKDDFNCDFILGNHEQMLLGAMEGKSDFNYWLKFGGKNTLDSYKSEYNYPPKVKKEHLSFIKSFVDYVELENYIITHASFNPNEDVKKFSDSFYRWNTPLVTEKHVSGKLFILGHTRVDVPYRFDGCVLIDTCSGKGESITAICLEDNLFITSNPKGIIKGFIDLS